jgi:hypothetical protein
MEASRMRDTASPSAANTVVRATLVVIAVFGAFGCGDDDGGSTPDGGPSAGRGGSGGRGGSDGAAGAPIEPLTDKTAGKSCRADKDCGTGTCLADLPGSFGAGMAPAPDGYCSAECMVNEDCGEGGACSGAFAGLGGIGATRGRCLKSCTENTDCRDGYRCVNAFGLPVTATDAGAANSPVPGFLGASTCQPLPATDKLKDGIVGSECAEDEDCGDGRCLKTANATTTYPGGYCTGSCLQDSDCGSSGTCSAGLAGGAGTCYLKCSNDSDCSRDGYRCRANGEQMQCVPGAAPLLDGVVGNACTGDAECGGAAMSCGTRLGFYAAPGGYCTQRCVNSTDCGAGGVCVGGFGGAGTTAGGTCYKACADASGCRDGYTCGPAGRTGTAATQNICSVTPPPMPTDDAGTP